LIEEHEASEQVEDIGTDSSRGGKKAYLLEGYLQM
jgi:hypothetical protein